MIQINAAARLPPKSGAWHQDGFPTSKLPGSPPSFSAWRLCSPSSCCPLGERGRQDEQITIVAGDHDLAVDQERYGFDAEGGINDAANGKVEAYRAKVRLSFKYEGS